ncbi:MAG: DNA-3-methyladenine glycosylase 2 family protein [Saprospiraceae bacterium]|nr:DNA-3-methyladenine glycosylase 2 family protein [Saprospiraceae bacterium]
MASRKILRVLNRDPVLKNITHLRLEISDSERDVFQDLVRSIISQQLSGKAAATIYGRFVQLFSRRQITPRKILNLSSEIIQSVGVSRQKSSYLQNIARESIANRWNKVDWNTYSDEELLDHFVSIKGVGTWTARMIIMFSLDREDIFPSGDVSVQNAMKTLYELDKEGKELIRQMELISENWSPYKTWATRYLWAWKDQ